MIGQTISHYKILEKLGEGGMGVVYKAHDTKLDRDVALKFLPRDVSLSEEERNRFTHEAKAASALDHPNICTIHEVGETPDGQMFIVMGYYKGRSISKMVEKGHLDVGEAVSVAIQIAEGLQAAHEKGIVHRDIKSSNIIVSDKGQVRILDFGLARKKGLSRLTKTGTTVGTASYMSPEQAQGESIDPRTDLWSLGVVLYEMVTGRLPFRGEHEAAILYSVVNEEPQPVHASLPDASPELLHIIRRAMEKDPSERYQTAADLLIDLKRLKKDTSRTGYAPVSGRRTARNHRRWASLIVVIVVVLCAAVYLFFVKEGIPINPDMTFQPLSVSLSDIGYPGISGDGNWIAFKAADRSAGEGLYIMHSSSGGARLRLPLSGINFVDLSPDGSLITYSRYDPVEGKSSQFIIHTNMGSPVKIGPGASGRFRPDGQRIGFLRGDQGDPMPSGHLEFWSASIDGREQRSEFTDTVHITTARGGTISFAYSPDGKKVVWIRSFPELYSEVFIHDLETGEERQLTFDRKHIDEVTWMRDDLIAYTTDRSGIFNVWIIPVSGGAPAQITKETTTPARGIKSSQDGRKLLYLQLKQATDFWIVDIARDRSRQISFLGGGIYPAFSPNGKQIAYSSSDRDYGYWHITVMDRDGKNPRQLSFGNELVTAPLWSPDGRWIAYGSHKVSDPPDSLAAYLIDPSSPEPPRYIAPGEPNTWLDTVRFQVNVRGVMYVTSVYQAPLTRVFEDSTLALFLQGGHYIVFHDLHEGKDPKKWWVVDHKVPREGKKDSRRILPFRGGFKDIGLTLYGMEKPGEIWRMVLPDGKKLKIPADFLGVAYFQLWSPSWDGKEMIIGKLRLVSNMVVIENPLK